MAGSLPGTDSESLDDINKVSPGNTANKSTAPVLLTGFGDVDGGDGKIRKS